MTTTEATAGTLLRALVTSMQFRESFAASLKRFDEQADATWDELAEAIVRARNVDAVRPERAPNLVVLEQTIREIREVGT